MGQRAVRHAQPAACGGLHGVGRRHADRPHVEGAPLFHEPQPGARLGALAGSVAEEEAQARLHASQHEAHAQPRPVSRLDRVARRSQTARMAMGQRAVLHAQPAACGGLHGDGPSPCEDDHMSKALRYFASRNLARGWVRWRDLWQRKKRKRDSMRRSRAHAQRGCLAAGSGGRRRSQTTRACRRAARHRFMLFRRLAFGFVGWQAALGMGDSRGRRADRMASYSPHAQSQPFAWLGCMDGDVRGRRERARPHAQGARLLAIQEPGARMGALARRSR